MIYILTHPFTSNYGGGLQAYALQQVVTKIGYDVSIIEHIPSFAKREYFSEGKRIKWQHFKELIKLIKGTLSYTPTFLRYRIAKQFKKNHMSFTPLEVANQNAGYIVGSDQVWRLKYTRTFGNPAKFFLDFATEEQRNKSICYAASFGTDEWEGSANETATYRELLKDFRAVSVREASGITLCRDKFGAHAVQMPDPTILLKAEVYNAVIKRAYTWRPPKRYMAAYMLDSTEETQRLIQKTAQMLGLYLQPLLPNARAKKIRNRFPMSVPQWLRSIRDCEYLVTDSFHGCVFSIIFNKPFVCLGNATRGSSRFDTLMGTFGLQDRLLTNADPQAIEQLMACPIDWTIVNAKMAEERKRGLLFLQQHLPQMR